MPAEPGPRLIVLGPQRRPTVDQLLPDLPVDMPIATVTAGWREREPDDGEFDELLGGRTANLGLYGRWREVVERDHELATATTERRSLLEELRELYLVQARSALEAVDALLRRNADRSAAVNAALDDTMAMVRLLDERHLARVRDVHREHDERWRPAEREAVAEHRDAVRERLASSCALFVAGGHVGQLVRLFRTFGVADAIPPIVVSWSAGAMALTERVVLFHDFTPEGSSPAEVYDDGLGLLHSVVLLPHARRRLLVDDPIRMGRLVSRFAPAECVVLDDGVRVDISDDGSLPPGTRVVSPEGRIVERGAA